MRWPWLLVLVLAGTAATAAPARGQSARLMRPRDAAPPPAAADTADPYDPGPSRDDANYRARELARLRRRTGTPLTPAVPEQPLARSRSLITGDGGFGVRVETDAPEYYADDEGTSEPMFIRVTSEADGYLTLVSGGTGRAFTVLAPNDLVAQLPVQAGEPLDFPLREWLAQGIELSPQLPADQELSQQTLVAVVTRTPIPLPLFDPSLGPAGPDGRAIGVRTFQAWLARLPATQRGVGQASYVVRRR